MTLEDARKIVHACLDTKYRCMGITEGDWIPLPKVSLADMLKANQVVADNRDNTTRDERGGRTLDITIDPRGLAALYVRERYQHDAKDALEAMGWNLIEEEDGE